MKKRLTVKITTVRRRTFIIPISQPAPAPLNAPHRHEQNNLARPAIRSRVPKPEPEEAE